MEERPYVGFEKPPRKRCCRPGTRIILLGMATVSMGAVLLTLLILWRENTHPFSAAPVSRVSKDLERHKSDQMAQKSQAARMLASIEHIRAEQKSMQSQEGELSQNLDVLGADLDNLKAKSLNEKRDASETLWRLQEEVAKLWMELKIANGSACNICPEQWIHFQKKCYYFGRSKPRKWIQAKHACSDLQGRLVSIHSSQEQDFLSRHASKKGSWIGLQDLDREGEFVWPDGSPVDYSNWRPGEPNDQGLGENCVMLLGTSGQWNDASCRQPLDGWVCERLATC
ncbi:low affinity immunoglobulin epsilon Fc receptor [Echinops telfairi]|uniref:low affinity immunoglobulin epsilon Fc receptor n=1 Tax=Echinops telfairi TaxID=9371 RepID=UPI00122F39D6|nr:low affinity immunoglobulin epsilon Fc receptor [Echinops telfairi]